METAPGPDPYAAARAHLRAADPVLARLIDADPDFDPRDWLARLPKLDAFGALSFQVVGQQLSVGSTRAILGRIEALFGGRLPTAQELLAADPEALRAAGLSRRKVETLRTLAARFADGELGDAFFRGRPRRTDRGGAHLDPGHRAVDGPRLHDDRPRPRRRLSLRGPGAAPGRRPAVRSRAEPDAGGGAPPRRAVARLTGRSPPPTSSSPSSSRRGRRHRRERELSRRAGGSRRPLVRSRRPA